MLLEEEQLTILGRVESFLRRNQIESFLVGGFIRDLYLKRATSDVDLAVAADALKTAQAMAKELKGKFVPLDAEHGIARVVLFAEGEPAGKKPGHIDLSSFTGTIQSDLARRDFTINAMALPLRAFLNAESPLPLIDPFHGRTDLNNRQIRAVSPAVFQDDPLRLLRAMRLAAELDLTVVAETELLIRQSVSLITCVSGERIREELVRIFSASQTGHFVRYMDNMGLLTALIPELESGRDVEQPEEHHWKVLDHAIESVNAAGFLIRQGRWRYAGSERLSEIPWSEELDCYFRSEVSYGCTQGSLLKLAALLHDIAKPETKILSGEKIRFFGHDLQGADTVRGILERLRFSNKEIDLVEKMVRFHMRPTQISHTELPSRRAVFRYFRDTGSAGINVLFLSLADHLAARGPTLDMEQWHWHVAQVAYLLNEYFNKKETITPAKLIDGHDLIRLFSLKPGPEIREILDAIKEAQAAGEIVSKEEALSYVKNRVLYRKQNLEG